MAPLFMSVPAYVLCIISFLGTVFGLGWLPARAGRLDPIEKLLAIVVSGLAILFVAAFGIFALHLSWDVMFLAPAVAALVLWLCRHEIAVYLSVPGVRKVLFVWALVALWTQGLLTLVNSYSGAAWGADWFEHHQRTEWLVSHGPLNQQFIGFCIFTSRPPLANTIAAAFEVINRGSFACGQVILALFGSFIVLPATLFCRRVSGSLRWLPVLALLLMLNPAFDQNSTFAWTKLPAAFFILAGAYFLLTALECRECDPTRIGFAWLSLAAGVLTHYSAGPYVLVLGAVWLLARLGTPVLRRLALKEAWFALVAVAPLFALWFGWAIANYGIHGTFMSNTSVVDAGPADPGWQILKIFLNVRNTLVPHPFRTVSYDLIARVKGWAWFRDYFFLIVQVNLPAMLGTGGAFALALALFHGRRSWRATTGIYCPASVIPMTMACVVLGVAVVGGFDAWGLGHICLLPLVIVGLAVLAGKIDCVGRAGLLILGVGLGWDAVVNVGLHYWLQAQAVPQAWISEPSGIAANEHFGTAALNAWVKNYTHVVFLHDRVGNPAVAVPFLCIILAFTVTWVWRTAFRLDRANSSPSPPTEVTP